MANKKNSKLNKKSKDPKAPKRHRSAYILFSVDKRQQIKVDRWKTNFIYFLYLFQLENPGLSPKEIISELGALWKIADPQVIRFILISFNDFY